MNDDLEKRLQRVVPRQTPSAWREEILTAAQETAASNQRTHRPQPEFFQLVRSLLARPQRIAWAGLVAAWLVIGTLHFATRETPSTIATTRRASTVTPETLQALKQQRLLFAELVGRTFPKNFDRPKITNPGPRSQRREPTLAA